MSMEQNDIDRYGKAIAETARAKEAAQQVAGKGNLPELRDHLVSAGSVSPGDHPVGGEIPKIGLIADMPESPKPAAAAADRIER